MAVIDELIVRKGTTRYPIDSYNNAMIDEIIYEGQSFHFAKQKDLTGTSEIVADNAVDEPIISLGVSGNTTQKTYAGYNLFNQDKLLTRSDFTKSEYNGFDCFKVIPENFIHTFALPSLIPSGTKISFSFDVAHPNTKGSVYIYVVYEDTTEKSFIWYENTPSTVVDFVHITGSIVATQNVTSIKFAFFERFTYRPYYFKNFMLNIGEEKPYEPYVGGTYSPNPDYPQAIENANSEGTSVVLHGENLFNQENLLTDSNFTKAEYNGEECIKVVPTHTNAHTFSCETPIGENNFSFEIAHPQTGGNFSVSLTYEDGSSRYEEYSAANPRTDFYKFSIATTKKIVRFHITFWNVWNNRPYYFKNFMVNAGDPKPYEPYFREEIAIPASVEVTNDSTTTTAQLPFSIYDKLTVDRITSKVIYTEGSWQRAMTGNEAWYKTNVESKYGNWFTIFISNYSGVVTQGAGYCNYFKRGTYIDSSANNSFIPVYNSGVSYITMRKDTSTTLDEFQTWLKEKYAEGNPVAFLLKRTTATTIEHDITNTDLGQSLLALATRKGTNYLEVNGNLAPSKTDLSYWRQIIPGE